MSHPRDSEDKVISETLMGYSDERQETFTTTAQPHTFAPVLVSDSEGEDHSNFQTQSIPSTPVNTEKNIGKSSINTEQKL